MEIPKYLDPTLVTANGKVLHVGTGSLLVVDEETEKPVVLLNEISDEETVDIFIQFAPGAAFGKITVDRKCDRYEIAPEGVGTTHEVLVSRQRHEGLHLIDMQSECD